jgi:hypothetical protein
LWFLSQPVRLVCNERWIGPFVSFKVSFEVAPEAEGSSLRCLKLSGLGFSPLGLKAFPRDKIF